MHRVHSVAQEPLDPLKGLRFREQSFIDVKVR